MNRTELRSFQISMRKLFDWKLRADDLTSSREVNTKSTNKQRFHLSSIKINQKIFWELCLKPENSLIIIPISCASSWNSNLYFQLRKSVCASDKFPIKLNISLWSWVGLSSIFLFIFYCQAQIADTFFEWFYYFHSTKEGMEND